MDATEWQAVRGSALVVGALGLVGVLASAISYSLHEYVLSTGGAGSLDGSLAGGLFGASSALDVLATVLVPLLAVLLGLYLAVGRQFPPAACLAGAFLGALVAPVGHALVVALVPGGVQFLDPAMAAEFLLWVGRFVAPVLFGVLLGAVANDVRERRSSSGSGVARP